MASAAMAGSLGAATTYYNGRWVTAEEAARLREAERVKAPYSAGAPSAGAATGAAAGINPDIDYSVDPTGRTSLSNQSAQDRLSAEQAARLSSDAEVARATRDRQAQGEQWSREDEQRNRLLSLLQSNTGSTAATVSRSGMSGNEQDARAAAFSRAKDQAGKIARASLTSIAENMSSRGMTGSGLQNLRDAGAIQGAEEPLQELTRDQMMMDVNRAADISDMEYRGDITQRGQDLGSRQSYLNLLRGLY